MQFPYFADTTERGDGGRERRPRDRVKTGYFRVNSIIRHYWLTSG
jgi:hypothetical protein